MATFNGDIGNDVFTGGPDPDQATGGGGNDTLNGVGGDDTLEGDDGADTLDGGADNDRLYSGPAPGGSWAPGGPASVVPGLDRTAEVDTLRGGDGDDLLSGGYGDQIDGGDGNDSLMISFKAAPAGVNADLSRLANVLTLNVGTTSLTSIETVLWLEGSDFGDTLTVGRTDQAVIYGLGGDDHIVSSLMSRDSYGGDGNDVIDNSASSTGNAHYGEAGNDTLIGSAVADRLDGGADNDTISGGDGGDTLIGGAGLDVIRGEAGDDVIQGGDDNDTLYGGVGSDRIDGGSGDDIIYANVGIPSTNNLDNGFDVIDGGDGNDTLYGEQSTTLRGGAGNDLIYGGYGSSAIDGGDGDDRIYGRAFSSDDVHGGAGNDVIDLGGNGDEGHGGDGDDIIYAGDEPISPHTNDQLFGDAGNDHLFFGADFGSQPNFGNDFADGGDGFDEVVLQGHYEQDHFYGYALYGALIQNVEVLRVLSASDNSYGHAAAGQNFSYNFAVLDDLQGAGSTFAIDGSGLGAQETLKVDGSAETDGNLDLRGGAGNDSFIFGAGNDVGSGGGGDDSFDFRRGGNDVASGGQGDDGFLYGATFGAGDQVDGGAGTDTLAVQGNYPALSLAAVANVDVLLLLSASSNQFGDAAGGLYSYNVTAADSTVAADGTLTVQATGLQIGENLVFNGSAETAGSFLVYAGQGVDSLTGGAGSDGFFFGDAGNFTRADHVDGGAGIDTLALRGNYVGATAVATQGSSFTNIEVLALLSGHSNEFTGVIDPNGYDYDVTLADGNVAAGATLDVNANRLGADESVRFDGSAETNGSFRIFSGAGDDTLRGGAQGDVLFGGLGKDALEGGAGADVYIYRSAAESTSTGYDSIVGFDWHSDRIDIAGDVSRSFSQSAQGSLSTASFDADLAAGLNGHLGAGQAALFTATSGSLSGHLFAVIDTNGQAGYQAGQDLVIELVSPVTPIDPAAVVIV